jgi:hypothetical protein
MQFEYTILQIAVLSIFEWLIVVYFTHFAKKFRKALISTQETINSATLPPEVDFDLEPVKKEVNLRYLMIDSQLRKILSNTTAIRLILVCMVLAYVVGATNMAMTGIILASAVLIGIIVIQASNSRHSIDDLTSYIETQNANLLMLQMMKRAENVADLDLNKIVEVDFTLANIQKDTDLEI